MKTKYKNKKLNLVIKYLCTFFIIVLCSQMNTVLNFSSFRIVNAKSDKELQKERNEYFTELAKEMNDLFDSLNYSIWERFSAYLGKGKAIKNIYYEIPIEGTPFTKNFHGPDPVKDLTENWIIISKVTSRNGKRIFNQNGEYAFNGTHLAKIITVKKGEYQNKRIVDKLNFVSFNSFLSNLILSAHDRYLSGEEQFSLTRNRKDFARNFEQACITARDKGTLDLYQEAARIFNSYTSMNSISSLYTAHIIEKDNLAGYNLVIGVNEKKSYPVLYGENQTFADILEIRETVEINFQHLRFRLLDSFFRLKYDDKQSMFVDDFFKLLERQSNHVKGITDDEVRTQSLPDDFIYGIETDFELDPGDPSGIFGNSLGTINTKNYADYTSELLAVAVICTDSAATNIDNLLAEAFNREVFAFIDRFEFSKWGNLLLDDNMDIRYYDVVFISDQELTAATHTWNEDWELTSKQKHILETFIFTGGSIYFSSSISNQESWVRDRYMPVSEIQARTNNKIANSDFDKGMPFIKTNTIVLDSCDETDDWYEAIDGEGNTWEWERSHSEQYLIGERTENGTLRFGIPYEEELNHLVSITATSENIQLKNFDKYKISTKLAPANFNPHFYEGPPGVHQSDTWFFSTKIGNNRWAKIGFEAFYGKFAMGVSTTKDGVHESVFINEYYYESNYLDIKRNGWHTLDIAVHHVDNGITSLIFIINGNIETIMEIDPDDDFGFDTNPALVDFNLGLQTIDRNNPDGFMWLEVDYVDIIPHDYNYDYNWISNTETPVSAHKGYGEFAIIDEMDGIFPNSLHLGIKKRKIDGEWFFDSYKTDLSLMVNQTIQIPNSFVEAYFQMDYKKLTSLESDRLDVVLFDENDKLIHTIPINNNHYLNVNWTSTGKIDLTQYLRGQAGKTVKVAIWVHGTNTRIRDGTEDTYTDIYADFTVDRPELFFIGGVAKVPIYVVYDQELIEEVGSTTYGYNKDKDMKLPYHSVDPYRSFYFAEELMAKLIGDGMLNTHQINIAQLKNIFTLNQQCVVINTHPLPESVYNGSANSPLVSWISSDSGIYIDTMEEPLGYFIDEDEYILVKVEEADLEIFGYDFINSFEYRDFSSYLWYGNWQYRKTITINNPTATELTDYPIYLKITNEPEMLENYQDIRFTTKNGLMLSYELESFDNLTAHFWVKIPILSDTCTEIFMYYGNPDATDFSNAPNVWDENYVMIQHFEETSSTEIVTDSTSYECDFTDNVDPILDSLGKIGSGVGFDSNSFLKESTGYSELVGQSESTISFWMAKNDNSFDPEFIFDWNDQYRLFAYYDKKFKWEAASSEYSPYMGYSTSGGWSYITITWDGTTIRYYRDGNQIGTDTNTGTMGSDASGAFTLGQIFTYPSSNYYLNGKLDEFRQSTNVRGSSWIKADYEFMTNQDLHIDFTTKEAIGITEEEYQLFYLENFDDKITEIESISTDDYEILLDDYIGGYLSLTCNNTNNILQAIFENPIKAHESIDYETVFLHADLSLTNTTIITLTGKATDGSNVTFICVLGEDFDSYSDNLTNTFYMSIPFNSKDSPSELIRNTWNSLLINLDKIADEMGSDKTFDLIYSIEINCTESIKLDNIWIGRSGSTMQQSAAWVVTSFDEFTSDYPISLSVLEQMKREIPGFSFAVFGRSEGVRELIFREDFVPETYPINDLWTEELFEYWQVSTGGTLYADEINVCSGNYSVYVQFNGTQNIELDLFDANFDIGPYSFLKFALMTNSTITDNTWLNDQKPLLQLVDTTEETLSFELSIEGTTNWNNITFILDKGINSGLFDMNDFEFIRFIFPVNSTELVTIFIDSIHFESSLNKEIWTWDGFLPILQDYIEFEVVNETIWFETIDEFGLGTFEFLNEFDPLSNVEFGLSSDGYGEILFQYTTKIHYWWNTNWEYNRNITIQNQNELVENYPVLLTIENTSTIHSHTLANGYDIRFINGSSGYLLNYWIEEWDPSGTSKVWIEIPKLLPYQIANITIYYGNPNALPCSDGRATFDFFDDFSYNFLDLERWGVYEYPTTGHYYDIIDNELHVHASSYGSDSGYNFETNDVFNISNYSLHVETSWSDLLYREAFGIYNGITLITTDDNQTGCILGLDGANQNVLRILTNEELLDYIDVGNYASGQATYDYLYLNDLLTLNLTGSYSYSETVNVTEDLSNIKIRLTSYVDWITGSSPRTETYFDLVYLRRIVANEPIAIIDAKEVSYTNAEYSYIKAIIRNSNGNQEKQIFFEEGFNPSKPHVYKIVREENSIIFIIDDRPVSIFESNLPSYNPPSHKIAYTVYSGKMKIHWIKAVERQPYATINYNAMILDGYGTSLFEEFEYRDGFPEAEGNYNENEWWYVPGYNSDFVTSSLVSYSQNNWDNTLCFEYDGDNCPPLPYEWQFEKLERQFSSVLDFNVTAEVDWWSEHVKSGRKFYMDLYNVDQNLQYTRIGYISLYDAWAGNAGLYKIKLGDTIVDSTAPLVGPGNGAIFEVIRDGTILNATIYSHDKSTVILTLTITNANVLPLNCIQLDHFGKWGTCMTPTYSPSHSKTWVNSLKVSGIGSMFPTTSSGNYQLTGEVFVDPVVMSHNTGYFGFVKNTPIKPLTVNFLTEFEQAANWISYIIENYFANIIIPDFNFYWEMLPQGAGSEAYTMYGTDTSLGTKSLNFVNKLNSINSDIDSYIPSLLLNNFIPNLAFTPNQVMINGDSSFDYLNTDGFIREWMINTVSGDGVHNYYPSYTDMNKDSNYMMSGSTLFHTTFNESLWDYNGNLNLAWNDFGIEDWQKGSGLVYDPYLKEYVLRVKENSLIQDSSFEQLYSLWNDDSPHYVYVDDFNNTDTNSTVSDYRCNIDGSGWPAPSIYFFNPNTTETIFRFGSRFNLTGVNTNIENFILEFDYWISHANNSLGFEALPIKLNLYQHNEINDWLNPLDYNDTLENYTLLNTKTIYLSSEFTQFDHFSYDYSSVISNLHSYKNYLLEFEIALPGLVGDVNKQNQTLYLDELTLTPTGPNGANGSNTGFGIKINPVTFAWNELFDSDTIGLVINYPFVSLEDILTTDYIYEGGDYEFIYTVYDPTYDYTINIHYCWSDDDELLGEHFHNEISFENFVIDYYVHCVNHHLMPMPQDLTFNLLYSLNEVVRLSGITLDREHIVHTLGTELRVDTNATMLQISSLSITGIAPWKFFEIDSGEIFSSTDIFGEISGLSELTFLADAFIWSDDERIGELRLTANCDTAVYINDALVTIYDAAINNNTRSPQGSFILKAGLNKIQVRVDSIPTGSEFKFWILKEGTLETIDDDQITSNDILREGLRVSTTGNKLDYYPMVSTDYGTGRIALWTFDFDSIGSQIHSEDEPLICMLSNIANYEYQMRYYFPEQIKNRFIDSVEWNNIWKHTDAPYDCWNKDDKFKDAEDDLEILQGIEEIALTLVKNYPKILAAAREHNGIGLNYNALDNALESFFVDAQLTGSTMSWFTGDTLDVNPGCTIKNESTITFENFDDSHTIFTFIENQAVLDNSHVTVGFIRGWEETDANNQSCVRIQLCEAFRKATWSVINQRWVDANDPASYINPIYGNYRIYNHTHVWVDSDIKDDSETIYLKNSASTERYYSLLEVLNATAFCTYELSTYREETEHEPLMSQFQNWVGDLGSFRMFGIDVTAGAYNYMQNIHMDNFQRGTEECYNYLMNREFEYVIELCQNDPALLFEVLGITEDLETSGVNNDISVYFDPEILLNKTTLITTSFITTTIGLILLSLYLNQRGTHSSTSGEKQIGVNYNQGYFAWKKGKNLEMPLLEDLFMHFRVDNRHPDGGYYVTNFGKLSELDSSITRLLQGLQYNNKITLSTAMLLNRLEAINAMKNELQKQPNVIYTDEYQLTKVGTVYFPTFVDSANTIKGALKTMHSEYELIRWLPSQSAQAFGIIETLQCDIIYGNPINKLLSGLGDRPITTDDYGFLSLDFDYRINFNTFEQLMKDVFGDYPTIDKDGKYEKYMIAKDTNYEYYQLSTFGYGYKNHQNIIFRKKIGEDIFEMVTVIIGGQTTIAKIDETYEISEMHVLYGDDVHTAITDDGITHAIDLWDRGFGGFQLFGQRNFGTPENPVRKNCYIFTKGEAFCVLPGMHANGAPNAKHIELNYYDGYFNPNNGLITDTPNDNSVFINLDRITGTIQTIYKNHAGGTKGVVINYRPSFNWFLKQFISMIRKDFFLCMKFDSDSNLKYQNPSNSIFLFLNLLALPLAHQITARDSDKVMIEAIEEAKYEMLKGTGLLKDDVLVEGITPIFDWVNDEIIPINSNGNPIPCKDGYYQLESYHCESLFGVIKDRKVNRNWVDTDCDGILNNHQPLKILLENHQKQAPTTNWFVAMPNYKYLGIGQVFLKLIESRYNRILDYKISIELENLLEGERSYGDVDDLLAETLMFAQDVSYGRLGTLGDVIFAINPASDGYHTTKKLVHCMPGMHGIKKHRDFRDFYNWELVNDEWKWVRKEKDAYLPVKGIYNIFALLERFFYSNEAVDAKADFDPKKLLQSIYGTEKDNNKGLLPNPFVTRFPTKVLIDGELQTVTTHVDLATQSGIRLLLSFFMKLTYMTQNVVNKEFKAWLDLLDCMNAFGNLRLLLNDDVTFEGIRYTDTDWQDFADSTNQKERGKQETQYSPKVEIIQMPFLDIKTALKINPSFDELTLKQSIAGGLMGGLLNVPGTDLSMLDLMRAMIFHVDSTTGDFYKILNYQKLNEDGTLPNNEVVIEQDIHKITADDFYFAYAWNDPNNPFVKGDKPYTKKGEVVNPFLSKFPVFKQLDSNGQWNSETGRYRIYLLPLNGKETHKAGSTKASDQEAENLANVLNFDVHDTYALTKEQFFEYLRKDLKLSEEIISRIDITVLDYYALCWTERKLLDNYKVSKDITNERKDQSVFQKAKSKLDQFFSDTIWLETYWRALTDNIPARMLGHILPGHRNIDTGYSVLPRRPGESKDAYHDRVKTDKNSIIYIRSNGENEKSFSFGQTGVKVCPALISLEYKNKLSLYASNNRFDPLNALLNPESIGNNGVRNPKLQQKTNNPKSHSRDNHDGHKNNVKIIGFLVGGAILNIAVGQVNNFINQMNLYHIIACIAESRYMSMIVDNMQTMCDLNNDGLYTLHGEQGKYVDAYNVTTADQLLNQQNNLTRYKTAIHYAIWVWVTDYMELGGEFWEFVNGYLAGEQLGMMACGMPAVFADDIASVANAYRAKRQLEGKDVPDDPNEWIRSKSFQRGWQWTLLFTGAAVSTIGSIRKFGTMGALAFPATPWLGAFGGVIVGYLYSVVSVVQSLAAGMAADVVWTEGTNAKTSNMWQQSICYSWTYSLKGDRDNLIWFFNVLNQMWLFGVEKVPWLRPEWGNFLYWNTYFDLGPWAGPGDSLLIFSFWLGYCLTIEYWIFKLIAGVSWKLALVLALTVFVVGTILYVVAAGILHLLKKWNLLPNIYVADPYKGDYQMG